MIGRQFVNFTCQVMNPSEADFAVGGIGQHFLNYLKHSETMTVRDLNQGRMR